MSVMISVMISEETRKKDSEGPDVPQLSLYEKELPRWFQVPVGIVLGLVTLFCGFAVISLLFMRYKYAPALLLLVAVGLLLLLGCYWILAKCIQLITGRSKPGGLLSPRTLRIVSVFLLILPVVGLFTGYFRERGAVAVFQAVMYFFGFLGLRALAHKREAEALRMTVPKSGSRKSAP
jgi:hypothetical protein